MYLYFLGLLALLLYRYRVTVGLTLYPYYVNLSQFYTHARQTLQDITHVQVSSGLILYKHLKIKTQKPLNDGTCYGYFSTDREGNPQFTSLNWLGFVRTRLELFKAKTSSGVVIGSRSFSNLEVERYYDIQLPDDF